MIAVTRGVSPSFARCELTHRERTAIDLERAQAQHRAYQELLASLGCDVIALAAEPELPDAVFVEDAAVVLDELAVVTRPGAVSRRPETPTIAAALAPHRELAAIEAPGTLDGGDVLRVGRTLWVGLSGRTNAAGIAQLAALAERRGYEVRPVPVSACLHLKSAVSAVGPETLLVQRAWIDVASFGGFALVDVDAREPHGANALLVGTALVYSASHPRTLERLAARGLHVCTVDVSEIEQAEGAVTCCSLVFEPRASGR